MPLPRFTIAVLLAFVLPSCISLKVGDEGQACNDEDQCLPGLTCELGTCRAVADAGGDGSDDAGQDSGDADEPDAGDDGGIDADLDGGDSADAADDDPIAPFEHGWSDGWGANSMQKPEALGVDSMGNVYLFGEFDITFAFDAGEHLSAGGDIDIFLAKFDPSGGLIWARGFGSQQDQFAGDMVVDPTGEIYVTGKFGNTLNLGTLGGEPAETLVAALSGYTDIYVAHFDTDGEHQWSRRAGDTANQVAHAISLGDHPDLYIAGGFHGTIDEGLAGSISAVDNEDAFILQLSTEDGSSAAVMRIGSTSRAYVLGLLFEPDSSALYVVGEYLGTVDLCRNLPNAPGASFNVFLARFGQDLTCQWTAGLESTGPGDSANVSAIAYIPSPGSLLLTGRFEGGLTVLDAMNANAANKTSTGIDCWATRISESGFHEWTGAFGSSSSQSCTAIAVDALGNYYLAGTFVGDIDLGGDRFTATGMASDLFLAQFSGNGVHRWSTVFGAEGDQVPRALIFDAHESLYMTGTNHGQVDFGGGAVISATNTEDIFLVRFDPVSY